ncbi:MAG: hypothetical protein GWO24_32715, partial [Akkermansiaceae bacterium]|nr:hypothetical protein [Akkermansiaceae bacterium]
RMETRTRNTRTVRTNRTVRIVSCVLSVAACLACTGYAEQALTTEIPPEIIEGTPMPVKVPNLLP